MIQDLLTPPPTFRETLHFIWREWFAGKKAQTSEQYR
jgi:hypothetical protein